MRSCLKSETRPVTWEEVQSTQFISPQRSARQTAELFVAVFASIHEPRKIRSRLDKALRADDRIAGARKVHLPRIPPFGVKIPHLLTHPKDFGRSSNSDPD